MQAVNCTINDDGAGYAAFENLGAATLDSCQFTGNQGAEGGAITNFGQLILNSSTLSGNSATVNGGAIMNYANATLTNCTLAGNMGGNGGAIENSTDASLMISSCDFNNNTAGGIGGGGIDNGTSGAVEVVNSTFSNNSSSSNAGAIVNYGTFFLGSSTLVNNTASQNGGGIDSQSGSLTVADCTLTDNSAANGGGIYFISGNSMTLVNDTIVGNQDTGVGGGIDDASGSNLTLTNTIVAQNENSITPDDIAGTVNATSSYNLIGLGGSGGLTNTNGNQVNVSNPGLDPNGLQNNGGPTQTIALLPGSQAIDAGTSVPLTTDQRGMPRPDQSGGVDIGAFEYFSSVTASTLDLASNAPTLIITGDNFDPTALNNTVVLSSGAGNVTAATATSLTVTFTTPPSLGALSAVVTTDGGSSGAAVQVATVVPVATSTTVNPVTATFSNADQSLTLNATVDSDGVGVNESTVTFTVLDSTGQVVGTPVTSGTVTNGNASVVFTLPANTPGGTYTIQAVFQADSVYQTSSGSALLQVNLVQTTTTLAVSLDPTSSLVDLTATVQSPVGTPTGTVIFMDGTTVLGTAALDANGTATLAGLPLVGTNMLSVVFQGTTAFAASNSQTVEIDVQVSGVENNIIFGLQMLQLEANHFLLIVPPTYTPTTPMVSSVGTTANILPTTSSPGSTLPVNPQGSGGGGLEWQPVNTTSQPENPPPPPAEDTFSTESAGSALVFLIDQPRASVANETQAMPAAAEVLPVKNECRLERDHTGQAQTPVIDLPEQPKLAGIDAAVALGALLTARSFPARGKGKEIEN